MATFNTCVRRADKEYNTVYIQVIHNGKATYIKTAYTATKKQLKGKHVKDNQILIQTNIKIKEYVDRLNTVDAKSWTAQKVREYITRDSDEISFTDYFKEYIFEMSKAGRINPIKNYKSALNSLKRHLVNEKKIIPDDLNNFNINFSELTIEVIKGWIASMANTARAKNLYPFMIKAVFDAGLEKYNDYNTGTLLIKNYPFRKKMIPSAEEAQKRAISKSNLLQLFNVDLTSLSADIRPKLAKDVAKIIFHLAGINTVDLYELKHENYTNGKLKYMRHKTFGKRKDKARFEISVPDEIKYLFEKYKGKETLFDFADRYTDFNSFNLNLNKGFKKIHVLTGVKATTYTFRHSWATIAQNHCGASDEEVGFCLNHASAHKETVLYIDKDFSKVDIINRKVIDYLNEK